MEKGQGEARALKNRLTSKTKNVVSTIKTLTLAKWPKSGVIKLYMYGFNSAAGEVRGWGWVVLTGRIRRVMSWGAEGVGSIPLSIQGRT